MPEANEPCPVAEDDAPDAVVTAVQAAITKAAAPAAPDPEKFVPAELVTSLQAQVRELMADKTGAVVDQAIKDGKVPPANRDWAVAYHAKDPEGFAKFLEGALRNPGAADGQQGRLFIGFAAAELLGLLSFVVAMILVFVA